VNKSDQIFNLLIQPGERLPHLMAWLKDHIWSAENFNRLKPQEYIEQGEKQVFQLEELLFSSAWSLYDEIVADSLKLDSTNIYFTEKTLTAIVVFDGASIRELALFEKLAQESGFEILTSGFSLAALPSDTEYFIEQRLLGKRLAPSQLPQRKELQENGITAFYYDAPMRQFQLSSDMANLLLWSHFPDGSYRDLSAKFSAHFNDMVKLYDTVWKNIVMQIPPHYQIIITSDHGYIFFGPGLDSNYPSHAPKMLHQNRYEFYNDEKSLSSDEWGLQLIPEKRLAMLRGRLKNRPQGPAGNKVYRHGGLSLMEMLTPYLVIKRKLK